MMKHPKAIVLLILVILAAVVFYQNRETIDTKILFFTVTMSRAAALSLSFLAGLIVGGTWMGLMRKNKNRKKASEPS